MLSLSTILSAGAFAWTANAFLLPLEVVEDVSASRALAPFTLQSHEVHLDCSGCPFALNSKRNGQHEWTSNVKSDLELKFSTTGDRISVNGVPFYPLVFPEVPLLSVKQVEKEPEDDAKKWEAYDGDLSMTYSISVNEEKHFANPGEEEADLVSIVFSVMGLDDQMITVDDIEIKVLKNSNSEVSPIPFHSPLLSSNKPKN